MPAHAAENVTFQWFEYAGRDAAYSAPLPEGHFNNPVLGGYYPDPAVTRVGAAAEVSRAGFPRAGEVGERE